MVYNESNHKIEVHNLSGYIEKSQINDLMKHLKALRNKNKPNLKNTR